MPAGALQWLRFGPAVAWALPTAAEDQTRSTARAALIDGLDAAAGIAERLRDQIASSEEQQAQANAAAICRWQLLTLRDRVSRLDRVAAEKRSHSKILRHLSEAADAAQTLSGGYRCRNLDRICRGGQTLDDQFEAMARLRVKLAATRA
jgi:hypothetical protein